MSNRTSAVKVSKYKMGWLLVLFDIPVMTKKERHDATRFRNDLLDKGYLMMQYSVYVRCAVTLEKKQGLVNELKRIAPPSGSIQCVYITDAQWGQIEVLHKPETRAKRDIAPQTQIGDQLQFWE